MLNYGQLKGKGWDEWVAFYREKAHLLPDELKHAEAEEREVQA
jgi:hypothetical protein